MASVFQRGKSRWIKFYPPGHSEPCRQSLGEIDPAMAELIRRRLELELQLRQPELRSVVIPENVLATLGDPAPPPIEPPPRPLEQPPVALPAAVIALTPSPAIGKVLDEYLAYIAVENTPHHGKNKIGYLKKFFGSRLIAGGTAEKGVFRGETLADVHKWGQSVHLCRCFFHRLTSALISAR